MANRKKSHRSRSSSRHHDRSPSGSPPKRQKSPNPPSSSEEKSLDSILQTLQQMQTEMSKTSERISTMESRFEQHSRTFAPSHAPDDDISVLAYSDGELLDYSEDNVSLTTEPEDQAIQPTHEAIKPPYNATRPPHTRPLGHLTRQLPHKHLRKLNQMRRPVILLPLVRRCTTLTQQNYHGNLKRNYPRS